MKHFFQLTRQAGRFLLVASLSFWFSAQVLAERLVIQGLDFQRNQQGHAVLLLDFSADPPLPDAEHKASELKLTFAATHLQEHLDHLYDTSDFATLVTRLNATQQDKNALIQLETSEEFNHAIHQQGRQLQIELAPVSGKTATGSRGSTGHFQYTGELMSLSYQNIPVRSLLKELADFLGLNLVAGEGVSGEITLQLQNVPSDQALDLILKTQNLASRQIGNVLLVAPSEELLRLEEQQSAVQRSEQAQEPLMDEFIRIHFARAEDISNFILGDREAPPATEARSLRPGISGEVMDFTPPARMETRRFLSDRGHLMVDQRTNQLYVRDTAEHLERIRNIVKTLDVPVDQVMIEARIVIARTGAVDDIGVTWGLGRASGGSASEFSATASRRIGFGSGDFENESPRGSSISINPEAGIGVGFVNNNFLLDLELAALESENRSEVISRPKVITSDRVQATITSGEELPYQGRDEDGNPIIIFRNAALRLEATPHITHDGRILMELHVSNDSKGEATNIGFTINTESVQTQVLVNNGETLVIGGIFTSQTLEAQQKVPILGDLPLVGWMFSRSFQQQERMFRSMLISLTGCLVTMDRMRTLSLW